MIDRHMATTLTHREKASHAQQDAYDEIIERIERQPAELRDVALRALTWVSYGNKTFTIAEIQAATAFDPERRLINNLCEYYTDTDTIISACQGLIVIDGHFRHVVFVDDTARDYVEKIRDSWLPNGDLLIAQCCITHLTMDVLKHDQVGEDWGQIFYEELDKYPLLDYASWYWGMHADVVRSEAFQSEVMEFLSNPHYAQIAASLAIGAWNDLPLEQNIITKGRTALHVCACLGLEYILQKYLSLGIADVNCIDELGKTPLIYAAEGGILEVVELLICQPDIDITAKFDIDKTALSVAAAEGNMDIVARLLDYSRAKLDHEIQLEYHSAALPWAAWAGKTEIAQLLLAQPRIGINVAVCYGDDRVRTPLQMAAEKGHIEIVRLLLTRPGIEINGGDCAALWLAAEERHAEIVELLLAQPGIETKNYNGSLIEAVVKRRKEVVRLMLAQPGVEVNDTDSYHRTPLFIAEDYGETEIVQLLLAYPGIDVNKGFHPLFRPILAGDVESVQRLLARPAVNVRPTAYNANRETPLHLAVRKSEYQEDEIGHRRAERTPEEWVERSRKLATRMDIINMLLAHPGTDIHARNVHHSTALTEAVWRGNREIVELLLPQYGIVRGIERYVAFSTRYGDMDTIRYLLAQPEVEVDRDLILTYVHAHSYAEVVQLLSLDSVSHPDLIAE